MGAFDILLGIPLLYALYRGFREGIILQLGGILGLILGIYLAFRRGTSVGLWFGLEEPAAPVVGFLVLLVAVLLVIALLGRLCRGLFKIAGLGLFDSLGGAVLSLVKTALLLSVLLTAFETLNREKSWVEEETLRRSFLYGPVRDTAGLIFPYLRFVTDSLTAER